MIPWETLAAFAIALGILAYLSSWIGRHLQGIGLLLTGHPEGGMVFAWLIFLPGVVLHETSHWIVARLLGLRPSRLQVWPERRGKMMRMGYVDFHSGDPLRDSLVGLAPFLVGCAVLLWIALQVFGLDGSTEWRAAAKQLLQSSNHPDVWLYAYLIFAISNGMMPSASDRQAWSTLAFYLFLIVASLYALGLIPSLSPATIERLSSYLRMLTYALGLAVLVDFLVALGIGLIELTLGALKRQRVVY